MIPAFILIILCFSSPVYAGTTDKSHEQDLTQEQQKKIA